MSQFWQLRWRMADLLLARIEPSRRLRAGGCCWLLLAACAGPAPGVAAKAEAPSTAAAAELSSDAGVAPVEHDAAEGGEAGDAAEDSPLDSPTPTADEPEARTPESATQDRDCPNFRPHLFDWKPAPALIGMNKSDVARCYGKPVDPLANPWRIRLPHGCSYEKVEMEVFFARASVTRAKVRGFVTGQLCQ